MRKKYLYFAIHPNTAYGEEIANEYRNNKMVYEKKIKHFTRKYANPMKGFKEYESDWDFSIKV